MPIQVTAMIAITGVAKLAIGNGILVIAASFLIK
jgi:hypothetical protein